MRKFSTRKSAILKRDLVEEYASEASSEELLHCTTEGTSRISSPGSKNFVVIVHDSHEDHSDEND